MTDEQVQLLLEFLQRVGLLRRTEDVEDKITLYQFPSLTSTATYHTTLLEVLPSRRPVCSSVIKLFLYIILIISCLIALLMIKPNRRYVSYRRSLK